MAAKAKPHLQADVIYGEGFDDGYLKLNQTSGPVVCFIDTLIPSLFPKKMPYIRTLTSRAEEITGLPCIVLRYTQLAGADMSNPNIKAILIDASLGEMSQPHGDNLYAFMRETRIPTIGFCGGHHHVYLAYGGKGDVMRLLKPGEADPYTNHYPGYYKEWGFMPVRITKRDPLFAGLPDEIIVNLKHAAHCTQLPPVFDVLATSNECPIQVIKHKDKLLYGTQFHAEMYDDEHLHGRIILQNFFAMAGIAVTKNRTAAAPAGEQPHWL
jgi:GMP synthase (glutamine-hydrolysing)